MKKFKTRNNHRNLWIIIIILIFLIIFIILSFFKLEKSNNKLIKVLVSNFDKQDRTPINLLTSNLDYLISTYSFKEQKIIYNQTNKKIYLYNTHNLEKYNDGTKITDATKMLRNNLIKLGINVIYEEKLASDFLHTGLSYYDISRSFLKDVMNKEKDVDYYIDIHRDSVNDTKIIINSKPYAKIMFVLGLENKNYENNKKLLLLMNDYLNKNYPGISKGIYEKKGKGVDGVYNQDLSNKVLLIELGGISNNKEEINNSTEIISLMLYHLFGD